MPEKAETQQDAIWQLAELIAGQRGDRWQRLTKRTREIYASALRERMRLVSTDLERALSGVDLFNTLNGPLSVRKVTWENVQQEERDLYTRAVQHFNDSVETPPSVDVHQTKL